MSLLQRFKAGTPILGEEFAQIAAGNTLIYFLGGIENYREYYPNSSGAVTLHNLDGSCENGLWYAQGDQICFDWEESGLVCSYWVWHDGLILSRIADETGFSAYIEPVVPSDEMPASCSAGMVGMSLSPPGRS